MNKIILFLIITLIITACYSSTYSRSSTIDHPSSTQSLMEFCAQSGGKYEAIQDTQACINKDSVCTLAQYNENKCINFNQCNAKPISCETGTIGAIEGCGCVTGLLCKTN